MEYFLYQKADEHPLQVFVGLKKLTTLFLFYILLASTDNDALEAVCHALTCKIV